MAEMKLEENKLAEAFLRQNVPLAVFWFPWFWFRSDAARLRRLKCRAEWKQTSTAKARSTLVIKTILWPLTASVALALAWCIYSGKIQAICQKGRLRQLVELLYFTFWCGCNSKEYYAARMILTDLPKVMADFIPAAEMRMLNIHINKGRSGQTEEISHKGLFEKCCRERDIATIPVLCEYTKGEEQIPAIVAAQRLTIRR